MGVVALSVFGWVIPGFEPFGCSFVEALMKPFPEFIEDMLRRQVDARALSVELSRVLSERYRKSVRASIGLQPNERFDGWVPVVKVHGVYLEDHELRRLARWAWANLRFAESDIEGDVPGPG